jgi:thiol-disulfide isomerase/thioredoxin
MRARILAALVTAVLAASVPLDAQRAPGICDINSPAPLGLTLPGLDGKPVPLTRFKGKVVLVNFWATWCEPCKIEIPDFLDLYRQYRSQGVEIVGIDIEEPVEKVRPYVEQMKITYPVLLTGDRHDEVAKAFGVDVGLPTTIVLNRDGTICRRRVGLTRKTTFELLLKALL